MEKAARSPWVLISGFHISRVWGDYLHIVDLALAPEAAASAPWRAWFMFFFLVGRAWVPGLNNHAEAVPQALLELTSRAGIFQGGSVI